MSSFENFLSATKKKKVKSIYNKWSLIKSPLMNRPNFKKPVHTYSASNSSLDDLHVLQTEPSSGELPRPVLNPDAARYHRVLIANPTQSHQEFHHKHQAKPQHSNQPQNRTPHCPFLLAQVTSGCTTYRWNSIRITGLPTIR